MQLTVISRYRTQAITYEEGQVLDLTDEQAAALLNDSPGSFRRHEVPASDEGQEAAAAGVVAAESPEAETVADLSAMSTETATGIVAPDRRGRGGRKRQ